MPKNDLISRADVLDLMQSYGPATYDMPYGSGDMIIRPEDVMALPAVDAVPVVHGRWIDENPDNYLDPRMRCSICTGIESPLIKWRYCPNCGAQMDGDDDG